MPFFYYIWQNHLPSLTSHQPLFLSLPPFLLISRLLLPFSPAKERLLRSPTIVETAPDFSDQAYNYKTSMESVALKAFSNVHTISTQPTMASGGHTISSPCAGCKLLRRKCQPDCLFAPYFPPDQPTKFSNVHRVFGASNVTKILNDLKPFEREDAVNSLAYEAEMRLRDPVYGCVGIISLLQRRLREIQIDLSHARSELMRYQAAAGRGIGEAEQLQQQRMMMMKGYAAAPTAVFGGNDGGLMMAMGMAQTMKRPSSIGGDDDRHDGTLGMFS